jgi:hypothetical protein
MSDPDLCVRLSRRRMLTKAGAGFGLLGLAGALEGAGLLQAAPVDSLATTNGRPHFTPRAKRVIFLFMNGAPSHVDTFDPKPALAAHAGQDPPAGTKLNSKSGKLMPSPFRFARHGDAGVALSELFPRLARSADDLCVIRSMYTNDPNHEPALLFLHSGHRQPTRPCLGSWVSYGLGSENQNLPAFVALCPGRPVVGPQLWSGAFLPGEHQGMAVDTGDPAVDRMVPNLRHPRLRRDEQRRQLDLLGTLNALHRSQHEDDLSLDAHIKALELAFHMQTEASDAFDLEREPEAVRASYGLTPYGQSCLLARRLVERGVRFVQVYYVSKKDKQPWDTHRNNDALHRELCADSDRATAALLADLKSRGLLDDTLVIWGGEFGRTPNAQVDDNGGAPGRDHHHTGFSMLLAGGGVRGGLTYGATDELGYHAVVDRVSVHDLHATILHVLGLDHTRLTYRYAGRDFRLTDVHGEVVKGILA